MSARGDHPGWGPQTQLPKRAALPLPVSLVIFFLAISSPRVMDLLIAAALVAVLVRLRRRRYTGQGARDVRSRQPAGTDTLAAVHAHAARLGGGVYLGATRAGDWRLARRERACLLLGPPRSGKTSAVIIPAVIAHAGPVVSTSTKPDVLCATTGARSQLGRVWQFDPTGAGAVSGCRQLRWSPVRCARSWDAALLIAREMVAGAGIGTGTTDQTHWARRAQALLAPMLHAAAIGRLDVDRVHQWVLTHELEQPALILEHAGVELGLGILLGLARTEARERSSIFSAAADALDAYSSEAALQAARDPNFDPNEFVRSPDTIYIDAPADRQHLAAPLVCGLLAEIRQSTYRAHHQRELSRPVLFALDEVANIAPIAELPSIASEGASQGLTLLAALQDLSQARARWGTAADGFLTLFGSKVILPGVADPATLEAISLALGEYDRPTVSTTSDSGYGSHRARPTRTISTQRQRVLSPGEVANIPTGHALHLDAVRWELLRLTPAHRVEPWATLTRQAGV